MHYSCIRTLLFFLFGTLCWLVLFYLSLSHSLRANPLHSRTLFIPGHHRLIALLFLSGLLMIKPIRTFRRTSPNMAFIRNAKLSYQPFSILLSRLSYIGGVENPFVGYRELSLRDYTGVLLQYTQIWLFYTSFHHLCSRYSYSSYSEAYLLGATHFEGITSWLPWMSMFEDCVQRRASISLLWDIFIVGWPSKHLMLGLRKRSEVSEYGDDICFTSLVLL